jgi:hypothetical protein
VGKLKDSLMNHADYDEYLNGNLILIIIDDESCDFIFVPVISNDTEDYSDMDEFDDSVDESNYNPYTGSDDFECYNEDY